MVKNHKHCRGQYGQDTGREPHWHVNPFESIPISVDVVWDLHDRAMLVHDTGASIISLFATGLRVLCVIERSSQCRSYIHVDVSSLQPHVRDKARVYLFALAKRLIRKWRREAWEKSEAARKAKYARWRKEIGREH